MSYLRHIAACNTFDPAGYRPFLVDDHPVGWVRPATARLLARFPATFRLEERAVCLHPGLTTPAERSAAVADVLAELAADGSIEPLRDELYAAKTAWHGPELFRLDRTAAPLFGLRAWGVHATGWLRRPDGGYRLWIGHRAPDKRVAPDKLDSLIGGGQPAGLTFRDNLLKEAAEETSMDAALAATAVACGTITYAMESETGLKADTLVLFDIAVPEDFTPRSTDGEHQAFHLMDAEEVLARLRDGDDFKFNIPLVLLDFCIRHGILGPDDTPEYEALVTGLHREHPVAGR
ncbi:MAG: DUF4743 domain-containing protein [Caenispirillum sp.]|nr:DUF4743 domain-containing protein [Caenispirillum sp.]